MARYRKIDPRIWNDAKFRSLSDAGKLAFLFLLTHPHMTSLGAMRATTGGLAEELGWTAEAFREAFREALSKGIAEDDREACLIALPNFIRYNPPESPNVIKAWLGSLDLLPECRLKTRVVERAKGFAEGLGEAFAKALPEAFAKAMPNQEQEQEQEQEPKLTPPTPRKRGERAGGADFSGDGFNLFWSAYPKKVSKGHAEKSWAKLRPDAVLVEQIVHAVNQARLSVEWQRDGGKFIPNPSTWLNGKRWTDQLTAADYTDEERAAFAAYNEILGPKDWPEAVLAPYSRDRAVALREFLTFSAKADWVREYMRWIAGTLDAKAGFGFDWVISRDAYIRALEGNFAKLREAA